MKQKHLLLNSLFFVLFLSFSVNAQTLTLQASKTTPGSKITDQDTLLSLFHFKIPESIPVTNGKAGPGKTIFKFH